MANNSNTYSDAEKEILVLKATIESINSMVNYEILSLSHNDPDSEIRFSSHTHQQFFNIILLDFLGSEIFGTSKKCMEALQTITRSPQHSTDINSLENATEKFQEWLNQDVQFEHNGETRQLWFPSINQEVALKITRLKFICICGNISKHNPLGLGRQAKTIKGIFKRNGIAIEQTQALLIMEEFYEQFHDDLFNYHSSSIAEFLNNIRWAVYEYLQPLYHKVVEYYWDERHNMQAYRYNIPDNITNEYVREVFWNLMNDIRSEPYMPRFQVTKYLKMRY